MVCPVIERAAWNQFGLNELVDRVRSDLPLGLSLGPHQRPVAGAGPAGSTRQLADGSRDTPGGVAATGHVQRRDAGRHPHSGGSGRGARTAQWGVRCAHRRRWPARVQGALGGGLLVAVVGTVGIPVPVLGSLLGACAGACLGAWILELSGGRDLGASLRAGVGAGVGRAFGTVIELGGRHPPLAAHCHRGLRGLNRAGGSDADRLRVT